MGSVFGTQLHLVGTIHRDPACYDRLRAVLERLDPDLITVEVSDYGLRFRQREGKRLAAKLAELLADLAPSGDPGSHPEIRSLLALLALPDEYRAAVDHARARGDLVPVVPVDRSDLSERKLALIESEVLTRENIRSLLDRPAGGEPPTPGTTTARARAVIEGRASPLPLAREQQEEMEARDRHIAQRILALIAALTPAQAVHICGWEHLIEREGHPTLRSLLAEIPPTWKLLDEEDCLEEGRPPRLQGK